MLQAMLLGLAFTTQSVSAISVLSPGTVYDETIPTLEQVVGHDFGRELSNHEQMVRYLRALAEADPDRTHLFEYARSWEGRPLFVLVIGNPERMARLESIKTDLRRFADPRGLSEADAEELLKTLPVVSWLLNSVHGDELSPTDAALAAAYHLLAARGDPGVDSILQQSIVLIDPLQNPDGRERFIFQNLLARGYPPDTLPVAAEHDETWPSGRVNHYLFDMNRDWIVQTQPETVGRTKLWLEWFPHVTSDLHEMGGVAGVTPRATYYFPPPAPPANPYLSESQVRLLEVIGRANAERFDERGFPYFTREVFGGFFPGTGVGWPLFHGGLGMTFEKASAHGLSYRRVDGTVLTYLDGVVEHFTAVMKTLETVARERERVLQSFLSYRRDAVMQGESGPTKAYLIPPGDDPALGAKLARTLVSNGIEVQQAEEMIRVGEQTYPEGTYVVYLAQPAGMMARNLLEQDIPLPADYLELQRQRRLKRYPVQVYDVSAWSLPLLYDIDAIPIGEVPAIVSSPVAGTFEPPAAESLPPARVAYLLPWNVTTAAVVAEALQHGIHVRVANEPFALAGRHYGVGTAIIRVPDHGPDLAERLGRIAARHGGEVIPTDTGFVDSGISLGSNQVRPLKAPRVLLAWDIPTDSYSAGWTRYVLERGFGQPASIVRVASLPLVNLAEFDVIVLPAGDYSRIASPSFPDDLRAWMKRGGTLITLGEASRWATREKVELLATSTEFRRSDLPPPDPEDSATLEQSIQAAQELPENTPGALARVILDRQHWLSAGTDGEIQMLVIGRRVFSPITLDRGVNVGLYAEADRLVAGGLIWEDVRDQLAQKAALIVQPVGRGQLVAFSEDPNFRAYNQATQLLFINAVLLGPVHLPIPGVE